jgi:membrane-associated protein
VTEGVIDAVASIGVPLLFFVIAGLAFADTAFFVDLVIPGEVGLVVAGAAVRGEGPLGVAVAAGALGAVAGDSVSYLVGRHAGLRLVCRYRWMRRRLEPKIERAQDFFARRGGVAVFLGRWVGALRAVVALVAGMGGMPYRRFLPWNVAASVLWVGTVVSLGYHFGGRLARAVDRYGLVVSAVALAGLLTWWLVRRHS